MEITSIRNRFDCTIEKDINPNGKFNTFEVKNHFVNKLQYSPADFNSFYVTVQI